MTSVDQEPTPRDFLPLDSKSMPLWTRPGFLVRRLNQIHYALFAEECAAFDLTPIQYGILTELSEHPDIDQISLAQEVGIDRSNAADILRRLEERGLIERRPSERDKRMKLSRLTEKGEQALNDMYEGMRRAQLRLLEPLSPEDQNNFIMMMMRLVSANNHLGRAVFRPT
jgi:DNA-binding MarR family transcriptional regulator